MCKVFIFKLCCFIRLYISLTLPFIGYLPCNYFPFLAWLHVSSPQPSGSFNLKLFRLNLCACSADPMEARRGRGIPWRWDVGAGLCFWSSEGQQVLWSAQPSSLLLILLLNSRLKKSVTLTFKTFLPLSVWETVEVLGFLLGISVNICNPFQSFVGEVRVPIRIIWEYSSWVSLLELQCLRLIQARETDFFAILKARSPELGCGTGLFT